MSLSPQLLILARCMAGEFENRSQAIADPIWYVHLRLWQRPVPLFAENSYTLFAEQASLITLDQPYRQRLLRLQSMPDHPDMLHVQYYACKNPMAFQGAGQHPEILQTMTLEQIELLPGCFLVVKQVGDRFIATPPVDCRCYFSYRGEIRQVVLGFEVNSTEYLTYDKGIDPETGKALWGATMGPYRYTRQIAYEW